MEFVNIRVPESVRESANRLADRFGMKQYKIIQRALDELAAKSSIVIEPVNEAQNDPGKQVPQ